MKNSFIVDKFNLNLERPNDSVNVSYSQFSTFSKCPLQWKLKYIDKIKITTDNIHTIFGDAMHTCIQNWIRVMFTESVKASEAIDFSAELMEALKNNYAAAVEKNGGNHFSTKEELTEFYLDGLSTLNWLRKKRKNYFSTKHEELIGIEVPILLPPDPNKPNILMMGYLDLVLRDKRSGVIRIPDLKTSKKGWSDWEKKDEIKVSQLLLYKVFFAEQYNVPIDDIKVEYIILKRKIDEDSLYPQRRVQTFEPSQGKISYNKALNRFKEFLDSAFLSDGSFNMFHDYRPICGEYEKNCKFCEYRTLHELCPPKQRMVK